MADLTWRFNDPFGDAFHRLWERAATPWPQAVAMAAEYAAAGRFPVNVYEDRRNYYVTSMMPGVSAEHLRVTVEGDVLTIAGAYKPQAPDGATALVREMGPMQFRRQFTLGGGFDQESVSAEYQDGILSLTIAKAVRSRSYRIPVGNSAASAPQPVAAGNDNQA
ncbi:MAG: Hsp20/alpha crystallin family protein [Chloroflexi bacterium]|nr:Hsp20/alpha crystallin family protein [Chloroflexota bacterium]